MKKLLTTTAFLTTVFAFDNQAGWKLDADGKIEMKDGNPVYINTNGDEMTVGGDTISSLNKEAKNHREAKEAAEAKLKSFEGLDPETAREAIETVKKVDAKALIDAGEVDKVKEEMKSQFTEQLTEKDNTISELKGEKNTMMIDKVFDSSQFIKENIAIPHDMFQDSFRKHFKVEDGQVKAYGKDGNQLMSKEKSGEYASPDEALKLLVESHSQKDMILKADDNKGSGGSGSGGMRGGNRTVRRADFEKLSPAEQADIAAKAGTGEVNLID